MPASCGRDLLASKMRAGRIFPSKYDGFAARNDAGKSAITLGNLHSCGALRNLLNSRILALGFLDSQIV
jgi:hypothetical protein